MKRLILIAILVFVGVAGWEIGGRLSVDAIAMGIGVIFGMLAGIPTTLLLIIHERSRTRLQPTEHATAPPPAAPVIILSGPGITPPPRQIDGPTIDVEARSWAEVDGW